MDFGHLSFAPKFSPLTSWACCRQLFQQVRREAARKRLNTKLAAQALYVLAPLLLPVNSHQRRTLNTVMPSLGQILQQQTKPLRLPQMAHGADRCQEHR